MRKPCKSSEGDTARMIYRTYIKRLLDIVLSLIGLPVLLLILLVCGPLIWLEDHGPVFYNAERLGRNGKKFKMYKLRSMRVNAMDIRNQDGTTYNAENDPRVTKIGRILRKTSLDEMPQLLNVLKGDMSLIGPRPDLPDMLDTLYTPEYMLRLEVRPGVTGYSQAYFRNSVDLDHRFAQDLYYVEHIAFWLDVKIFFKTAAVVLKRESVYRNQEEKEREAAHAGKM